MAKLIHGIKQWWGNGENEVPHHELEQIKIEQAKHLISRAVF